MLFFVAFISITLVSFSQILPPKPFNQVFAETVELNRYRFADINVIQPGDTVLLPSKTGIGTEAWVAEYPMYLEGRKRHDCMWRITERYMNSELVTFPVDTTEVVIPVAEEEKTDWRWLWLFLLLIPIAGLYLWLYWQRATVLDRNQVVPGGLSDDAATAATQIQTINPGARISRVERGRLVGSGRRRMMVMFNNGPKIILLLPNQAAYRVTELNGNITYYLQHCGNLTGIVANGRFSLPTGWSFISDAEANSNSNTVWERQPATQEQEVVEDAPIIPAPVPTPEAPVPSVDTDVVATIKAIGDITAPVSKISIKKGELDITVEFDQKK